MRNPAYNTMGRVSVLDNKMGVCLFAYNDSIQSWVVIS